MYEWHFPSARFHTRLAQGIADGVGLLAGVVDWWW
jgi:hypothetical protein